MTLFQSAEFWVGLAFVMVLCLALYPLCKWLSAWGEKQANLVRNRLDEANALKVKAEKLAKQYEQAYQKRTQERQHLIQEADKEIQFLKTDALQQSHDRMQRKQQEVAIRLKMIEENGRQDIKRKMLKQVVNKTKTLLKANRNALADNPETLTDQVCQALDEYQPILHP